MTTIESNFPIEVIEEVLNQYHVLCSVTEQPIPLRALLYWNVELQVAYSSPDVIPRAHFYPDVGVNSLETTKTSD